MLNLSQHLTSTVHGLLYLHYFKMHDDVYKGGITDYCTSYSEIYKLIYFTKYMLINKKNVYIEY